MKPYIVTYKFYYDGVHENTEQYTLLLEEPLNEEISGTDFDTLWHLRCDKGYYVINWDRYEKKKGRAFCSKCRKSWNDNDYARWQKRQEEFKKFMEESK